MDCLVLPGHSSERRAKPQARRVYSLQEGLSKGALSLASVCLCNSAVHATNPALVGDMAALAFIDDMDMLAFLHVLIMILFFFVCFRHFPGFPFYKTFSVRFSCRGHGGPSLAMPTKLWEVTGWETGRSFLYLQKVTRCAMDAES